MSSTATDIGNAVRTIPKSSTIVPTDWFGWGKTGELLTGVITLGGTQVFAQIKILQVSSGGRTFRRKEKKYLFKNKHCEFD
jgi:hypothetical protein